MKDWRKFWNQNSQKYIFRVAIVLFVLAAVASICLGSTKVTLSQLWNALRYGPGTSGVSGTIFWYLRLPRTAACILSGAALAVAGTVIQGVLANQLASPGMIGINAGAGLAVTICCAAGMMSGWAISCASFLGALFAVFLISFTAQKTNASRTAVILGGVAVNSFLNAVSDAITTLIPDVNLMKGDFRVGGFSSVSYVRLIPAGILIVIALILVCTLHNELDLMMLGEDVAQGLGLSVKKMRTIFLTLVAVLAGASVSFAGLLSFVGLIIPHIMRRIVGTESKRLLPLSAIGGAVFVTGCDVIARTAFAPYEVPVGILMSFLGAPFFIWLLLKRRGGHAHG